jgi:hypothetical protein
MRWPVICPFHPGSSSSSNTATRSGLSSRSARLSSQASAQHGSVWSGLVKGPTPRAFVFAHTTTPGWQWRLTAPLRTDTVFAKDSPHQVLAPNKVIELKKNSVMLEKKFEQKYEFPFFVSLVYNPHTYLSIL